MKKFITEDQTHKIKTLMFAQKLQVKDLPSHLGRSVVYWSRVLNGEADPRTSDILALSKLLGIKPSQIVEFFFSPEAF